MAEQNELKEKDSYKPSAPVNCSAADYRVIIEPYFRLAGTATQIILGLTEDKALYIAHRAVDEIGYAWVEDCKGNLVKT